MKKFILLLVVLCFFINCGFVEEKEMAMKDVQLFFKDRIENGGFGNKYHYSEIFWKNTDVQKWESIKNLVSKTHGDLKSFNLRNWQVKSNKFVGNLNNKGTNLNGNYIVFLFDTQYKIGNGEETITMFKGSNSDKYKIIGINFNSDKIQKLILKGMENIEINDNKEISNMEEKQIQKEE